MKVATQLGSRLPTFSSLAEAQSALFQERDRLLATLRRVCAGTLAFSCDFEPDSLKSLERWYFELLDHDGFAALGVSQEEFERCIAIYFGEVLVRNAPSFEWFVSEYAFAAGRYELGVKRLQRAIMLSGPKTLEPRKRNKRQQSLWRDYKRYTA